MLSKLKKMFIVISVVFLVTWAILKYTLHMRHMESYLKNVKGRKDFIPFLIGAFANAGKTPTELFRNFIQSIEQNGTPVKQYIGPSVLITLDKPEDVKAVLTSSHCLDKPYYYGFYPCPRGIFTERCKETYRNVVLMFSC